MRVKAIVNPAAGRGRSLHRWARLAARLSRAGISADMSTTSRPGDGRQLARTAVESGFDTLIAVGGDGTAHEVVNGIGVDALSHVQLAVLGAGTGMDFVRNAGLARRIPELAEQMLAGATKQVDVGLCRQGDDLDPLIFVNFAETGLGAAVVEREANYSDAWPGRLSFFLAALGAATRESNSPATVSVDGEIVYNGPLVSAIVANGRFFGGGMKVAPRAGIEDGLLDVLILGDFTRAQLVAQIWKIYPGLHVEHPKVLSLRGSSVEIQCANRQRLDLDGELYGEGPYHFSVAAQALTVIRGGP